jgi:hypothetical protein
VEKTVGAWLQKGRNNESFFFDKSSELSANSWALEVD